MKYDAVFSASAGAGAWVLLRYGAQLDPQWSTALAIVWGSLIYQGLKYGKGGK
jgi:hypothetical protein